MSFLYSFLNFLQPGILWPDIADLRPMLVISAIALAAAALRQSSYPRQAAFGHPIFLWLTAFMFAQVLSVYYGGVGAMLEEFSFWSVYLIFAVVSLLLISDTVSLKRYVLGMIAGGMFLVGYGIYAVYAQVGFGVTGRAGAYGMYENHNDYTFIILQIIPFIYLYIVAEAGLFRRSLLALSLLTCIAGVFLSLSRGGILALLLEFVLIVVFTMQGKRSSRAARPLTTRVRRLPKGGVCSVSTNSPPTLTSLTTPWNEAESSGMQVTSKSTGTRWYLRCSATIPLRSVALAHKQRARRCPDA